MTHRKMARPNLRSRSRSWTLLLDAGKEDETGLCYYHRQVTHDLFIAKS
jgi:hypothetical protein